MHAVPSSKNRPVRTSSVHAASPSIRPRPFGTLLFGTPLFGALLFAPLLLAVLIALPALGAAGRLSAQTTVNVHPSDRGFVEITTRDSSGAPVPLAEVTITRGLSDVAARGFTDSLGHALLSVALTDSTDLRLTMRKIGYLRGDRFFDAGPQDTASVVITVPVRASAELAPMRVTAAPNLRWKSYHLDADDIEATHVPLYTGWDVVKRLRPDILTSRGGCATGPQEVWVNGKRIRLPLRPTGMAAATARVGVPPRARFSYVPVTVLSEIAPEHIREIVYHDCFDTSMAAVGSTNAIFVTLQPGVVYQQDVGSFVLDETTRIKR